VGKITEKAVCKIITHTSYPAQEIIKNSLNLFEKKKRLYVRSELQVTRKNLGKISNNNESYVAITRL